MNRSFRINTIPLGLGLALLTLSGIAAAQKVMSPTNNHPNPYTTINDYFALPDGREWGSTSAVDIDIDGESVWVAERCGSNSCALSDVDPVIKYGPEGNIVTSFGGGMIIWPHGIHIDVDGNVWITDARAATAAELAENPDAAGKGHAVYKFSPEGEVLMVLGEPGVAGDGTGALLNSPNDVITDQDGNIYVGDGHGGQSANADLSTVARIAKFDAEGNFLESWGHIGTAPGEFRTPHSLAFDSRGRLFVADRGNVRIQIFEQDGTFVDEWHQFGRLSGIYIDANDILYAADSESSATSNPGWRRGIRIGSAVTGHVFSFIPDPDQNPGGTSAAEGVAADSHGNVYGAEVGPRQLVKYVRSE
ncbi:MAG: peptidyl-alpha-hydroxyglycine alpha-amidating lyase family protein [Gammaproteobacteria bacterium]|nr:peptidyl-alpha-hydroxyglycine alpha-amidating lyase family protein [Gammaproteobacteria bacterium]